MTTITHRVQDRKKSSELVAGCNPAAGGTQGAFYFMVRRMERKKTEDRMRNEQDEMQNCIGEEESGPADRQAS